MDEVGQKPLVFQFDLDGLGFEFRRHHAQPLGNAEIEALVGEV
jgi:hypothetical protein